MGFQNIRDNHALKKEMGLQTLGEGERGREMGLFYTIENPTKCATSQKMFNDKPL